MNSTITTEIVRGMSSGECVVTGVARVVETLADCDNVQTGDIIIAVMTKDEWSSALARCAGIVVDQGGDACHAILYGKKHGIPVIVGTGSATKKIRNGDVIVLDCSNKVSGSIYLATHNDFRTKFKPVPLAKIPVVVTCKQPSENKNVIQYVYYSQYYHDSLNMTAQKQEKKNLYITKKLFNKHHKQFIRYVFDIQKELNNGRWWGESIMFAAARKLRGCDDFAIECIPLSYNFFDQPKQYIESILTCIDLEFVNNLFEKYTMKPHNMSDMNWLARISHEEHIRTISLPSNVAKEELSKHPSQYKKLMDENIVEQKECDVRIAGGLLVQYFVSLKKNI